MTTLMQAPEGDQSYRFHRPSKKNDYQPVPLRWMHVLHLHLAGRTIPEIKRLTGYSVGMIYRILGDEKVQHVRQQLLEHTQREFEALFADVVQVVREGLEDPDPRIRLEATNQWLKAHGKFREGSVNIENITAEDVVFQILQGKIA